jgi:hypothetical protein
MIDQGMRAIDAVDDGDRVAARPARVDSGTGDRTAQIIPRAQGICVINWDESLSFPQVAKLAARAP